MLRVRSMVAPGNVEFPCKAFYSDCCRPDALRHTIHPARWTAIGARCASLTRAALDDMEGAWKGPDLRGLRSSV